MVRNGARLRGGNTGNTAPEVRFKPFFLMSVFPALIASHGHRPPQKINAEFGGCRPRVQRPAPTHTIVMPARLVFRLVLTVIREVLAVCCLLAILVIVEADLEVIVAVLGIVIVSLVVVLGPEMGDLDG